MEQKSEILKKYNDDLAHVYDEATSNPALGWDAPQKINELLLPHIKPGYKVLDIGVGTGQSAESLYKAGCKITGIDISTEMIGLCKEKFPDWNLYNADIEKDILPLEKESFDVVVASGIFEFVSDFKKVIRKIYRFLKPSGLLCFTFEEYIPNHELQHLKIAELGKGVKEPVPESISFFVYRRSLEESVETLNEAGLTVLKENRFTAYFKTENKIPVIYRIVLAKKN